MILAAQYLRHSLVETRHDCRKIYALYCSDVLAATGTPMAGLFFGYELLGGLGRGSFEHGTNTSAARSLCVRVLLFQMMFVMVMLAGCETVLYRTSRDYKIRRSAPSYPSCPI